jgi:crotonobetainyl-CoA:carnitine CoA-transferase CaiB-like acyl-CoA transferase
VLKLEAEAADPQLRTNAGRVANRARLVAAIQRACLEWKRAELDAALLHAGVPAGPIRTVDEVFADAQVQARHMVRMLASRDGEPVPSVRLPIRMDGLVPAGGRASPRLAEHQGNVAWLAGEPGPNPPE